MRFLLGAFVILGLPWIMATGETTTQRYEATPAVYVCRSPGAKRYHCDRWCRGLNSCKHTIEPVSQGKASNMGLTPCKMCY